MPRKSHAKKDAAKASAFKEELSGKLDALAGEAARQGRKVRVWVLDEHRYGLLPVIRRIWGCRGVRVHAPYATKYKRGYLHEALEVDGAHGSELMFTPLVDQDIHALFLKQISETDTESLHVVIEDQAGFHLKENDPRIPANMKLLPLPPYSPELNPVERFGGLIKAAVCRASKALRSSATLASSTALRLRIRSSPIRASFLQFSCHAPGLPESSPSL